ncbi:uncharacterized protein N7458_000615 [Penicillium daleae]|uniref:Uncharacterized protein n=1 Tax=Penicillium daleae TaxID=63821 RepID=A0AAD6CG90_9EURO|nr:uncharacterized protein N7458_000615 [Penicillium daleae]KAJ5464929.1 hypothetical protein N7458_000615 [Penicillium daleae]
MTTSRSRRSCGELKRPRFPWETSSLLVHTASSSGSSTHTSVHAVSDLGAATVELKKFVAQMAPTAPKPKLRDDD